MVCEEEIIGNKSAIASAENQIIRREQALGCRGESSIIRYY